MRAALRHWYESVCEPLLHGHQWKARAEANSAQCVRLTQALEEAEERLADLQALLTPKQRKRRR